jgi:non-heme chloroperoxidase
MKFADVNGTKLAYIEQGQGEAVVMVHGSLGDYRSFAFQMGPFSSHYRIISYSRRYHYPNPEDGGGMPYTARTHADDLAVLLETLEIEKAHIVGSSYGGLVGLQLGKDRPALVRSEVLGEAAIVHWLKGRPEGGDLFDRFVEGCRRRAAEAFSKGDLDGGVRAFADGLFGMGSFDRLSGRVKKAMLQNAVSLRAQIEVPFQDFSCGDARRVVAPCLILDGERSQPMFRLGNDQLQQCLPHWERIVVPNASHVMHASNPSSFNQIVMAFLAERPIRSG